MIFTAKAFYRNMQIIAQSGIGTQTYESGFLSAPSRLHIYLFYIILACLMPVVSLAQDDKLDSLRQVLSSARTANKLEEECKILLEIGNIFYLQANDPQALEYLEQGLAGCPSHLKELRGRFLHKLGMIYFSQGKEFSQVLAIMDTAYAYLQGSTQQQIRLSFLYNYGSILIRGGDASKGIRTLKEAETIAIAINKRDDLLLLAYNNLLAALYTIGDYDQAMIFSRKGMDLAKAGTNLERSADFYCNNGMLFNALGLSEDAEFYYKKSLELNERGGLDDGAAYVSLTLGNFYSENNDFKLAQSYLHKAETFYNKTGDSGKIAIVKKTLGDNYYKIGEYQKALEALDQSIGYIENSNDKQGLLGSYYAKASTLYKLNRLDSARKFASLELQYSKQVGGMGYTYLSYYLLHQIAYSKGDYEQALGYHVQYVIHKDSVFKQELDTKIAVEKTRQNLESEKEARLNAELQSRLLQSRNQLLTLGALSLLMISLITGYLFWQIRKSRKKVNMQNEQLRKLNATKDKFFGIIAHDLRGPINALAGVGEQMDYYLSQNNTVKLQNLANRVGNTSQRVSNLLDNLLQWALLQTGVVPYNPVPIKVKELADDNLSLFEENARAKNISFVTDIADEIEIYADVHASHTVLRNLISNAIKFSPAETSIRLSARKDHQFAVIDVKDAGMGIPKDILSQLFTLHIQSRKGSAGEKGSGLGLILCKELVEMHGGSISVNSEVGKGATFTFTLPRPVIPVLS